ncbi:hypothetical protein [Actinomadura sp. BRA 177]|uniref:hypothetical protein n=1 Tax=Actinomadura sp. BRA 177 TaxID=2745202 RepID=UPI00159502B0|nr:hypothetical protein [Actinomadura sp. BRA 177]NVI87510.1 hypothetical protein [Actinomadura sp. BRA 177]
MPIVRERSVPRPVWRTLRGPITPADLRDVVAEFASRHRLHAESCGETSLALTAGGGVRTASRSDQITLRWRAYAPERPDTLSHVLPTGHLEILLDHQPEARDAAAELADVLQQATRRFHPDELHQIATSMPLLEQFIPAANSIADWAIIFRDHYVENTLGFLIALQRAGVPARWIYALAKGDRTHNRDRVHATLLSQGCASGLLDNTAVNAPGTHRAELAQAMGRVDAFIDTAHAAGRKVLAIDDGGLLAQGYGSHEAPRRVDAAVELTVSGLKRITAAGDLAVPVLNLARSQLKTCLAYPEIADSCLRRLRTLLPAAKVIGRRVLVLGYGTLGSRIATALQHQGCQIHVTDPDPIALISAAEAGHTTHRTAADALRAAPPFLIVGTTGEDALTLRELPLLPHGAYLAPFATRDFSVLADPDHGLPAVEIPGVGRRYRLPCQGDITLLGDGRSMNLFEADSIPNQGYDAYRAGTLIAADTACRLAGSLPPGVHTDLVNEIIAESGLYSAYYDTYLATDKGPASLGTTVRSTRTAPLSTTSACVIGYGAAGRLHAQILSEQGANLIIVDPKHQDLPATYTGFPHGLEKMPETIGSTIGLWSVCCPTADHLPVLQMILTKDPGARVLLEKPACQGHEIDALTDLLAAHPSARVMVTDQYRHARAFEVLTELMDRFEPDVAPDHVTVTFTKDRTGDIAGGRFIDHSYGVLGYEWLHMLAVIRQVLPPEAAAAYLASDPRRAELLATYDPRLFVSALTERSTINHGPNRLRIELISNIASPTVALGSSTPPTAPGNPALWRRGVHPAIDRHRKITVYAGRTQFSAHLDPVTVPGGWQLDRNHHRVTAERDGVVLHDEVIHDSPLHTAIRHAAAVLTGTGPVPEPDLGPLQRIAALAELFRTQQPSELTEHVSA